MSHRIIIVNRAATPAETEPQFSFEYSPAHDATDAQIGAQVAKLNKLLNKAVAAASGTDTEE